MIQLKQNNNKKDQTMRKGILTLLLSLFLSGCQINSNTKTNTNSIKMIKGTIQYEVQLTQCVDGDTAHFSIDGKDIKVRFLSIDTPEIANSSNPVSEPFGDIASRYTCDALKSAATIILQMDLYENERDQYGRLLAWVWIDDQLLQGNLIEKGYAEVAFVKQTNLYSLKLIQLQDFAISKRIGLWGN